MKIKYFIIFEMFNMKTALSSIEATLASVLVSLFLLLISVFTVSILVCIISMYTRFGVGDRIYWMNDKTLIIS